MGLLFHNILGEHAAKSIKDELTYDAQRLCFPDA